MVDVETCYADAHGCRVAYQVVGSGGVDVLVAKPPFFPVDLMWDEPALGRFVRGVASFARAAWFDGRGTGASSGISQADGRLVEFDVDDMVTVVDALGWEQVVVLGLVGPPALLFAATHPERTKALVLVNPSARTSYTEGYPEGIPQEFLIAAVNEVLARWGTGWALRQMAPSLAPDARFAAWAGRAERLSMTPDDAAWRHRNMYEVDVRDALAAIRVETLVLYRQAWVGAPLSRYVAQHIPQAHGIEVPGDDFLFFGGEVQRILDKIETFVTGGVEVRDDDRTLATIMFTDIVGSTTALAARGDRRWRELLDTHDTVVRAEIEHFRGQEINTMGDAFVATFDGPGRAIRCAGAIRDALRRVGVEVRIGLHTGEIERRQNNISGIAVHIAQRIQAQAQPGEVLVSSTVRDLVAGSGIAFEDSGERSLKGIPDPWHVFTARP